MTSPVQTGQFADLSNGIRLHYAQAGTPGKRLVMFLHGFPEYWAAWEDVLPLMGNGRFCVAPDLRGFNLSSMPPDVPAYRAGAVMQDALLLAQHLGYERFDLVAHDWGGAIAWNIAIARPEALRHLVILNSPHPVPFARELTRNPAQQQASAYMAWLRAPGAEAPLSANGFARLTQFFHSMSRRDRPWLSEARLQRYREVWSRGLTGGLNYYRASPLYPPGQTGPASGVQLDPRQFVVHVPTLVLWGMGDTALLPSLLDGLDELVPALTIERVADATHWLAHEEPAFVAERIESFVAGT